MDRNALLRLMMALDGQGAASYLSPQSGYPDESAGLDMPQRDAMAAAPQGNALRAMMAPQESLRSLEANSPALQQSATGGLGYGFDDQTPLMARVKEIRRRNPGISEQQAYAQVADQYSAPRDRGDMIPQNSVRNNETGEIIYLGPQGASGSPQPQMLTAQMTGGPIRAIGAGNGSTVELSPEVAPSKVSLDYSSAPVEIMGTKAYYSKDQPGIAYAVDGSGRPTARDATYGNALRKMVTDPNSFQGTPGFQFALNTGLNGVSRANAAGGMRGSGNALAALTKYGTGLAMQDYGSQMDRLTRAAGQEQSYDLGQQGQNLSAELGRGNLALNTELGRGNLALGQTRAANDYSLGLGQNVNAAQRNLFDYSLGLGQNANTAQRNTNDLALGSQRNANDLTLGQGQIAATNARTNVDYQLGLGQNANAAQRNANDLTLGIGQNANNAQRNQFDYQVGMGANANNAQRNQFDYNIGLGNVANNATRNANDYSLGLGVNANNAQRNAFDYDLGLGRNANDAAANANQFNLGMFNAQTNRGNALADFYFRNRAANPKPYFNGASLVVPTPQYR